MPEPADSERSIEDRVRDLRLTQEALGRAVRRALLRHKQAGNPVAVWRNNQVVWLAPDEIPDL